MANTPFWIFLKFPSTPNSFSLRSQKISRRGSNFMQILTYLGSHHRQCQTRTRFTSFFVGRVRTFWELVWCNKPSLKNRTLRMTFFCLVWNLIESKPYYIQENTLLRTSNSVSVIFESSFSHKLTLILHTFQKQIKILQELAMAIFHN